VELADQRKGGRADLARLSRRGAAQPATLITEQTRPWSLRELLPHIKIHVTQHPLAGYEHWDEKRTKGRNEQIGKGHVKGCRVLADASKLSV
jgi:hypothetical protein